MKLQLLLTMGVQPSWLCCARYLNQGSHESHELGGQVGAALAHPCAAALAGTGVGVEIHVQLLQKITAGCSARAPEADVGSITRANFKARCVRVVERHVSQDVERVAVPDRHSLLRLRARVTCSKGAECQ